MAWEERHGRRYYYRKRRVAGRVVSVYLGQGEVVSMLADLDDAERMERQEARQEEQARRAELRRADEDLADLTGLTEAFAAAALLLAGCHTHKGTWRRKR